MIPDDEMLMAYADGELDPIAANRVAAAVAADPALAARVEAHRAIRQRIAAAYAPVADAPAPDPLVAMIRNSVVPFPAPTRPAAPRRAGMTGLAAAASLVVGIAIGGAWPTAEPVSLERGRLVADGALADTLDNRLASASGESRVLVSFRSREGTYCRVFATPAADGIACHRDGAWQLAQVRAPLSEGQAEYRQADSGRTELMAAAQAMMAGEPLDAAAEGQARRAGWVADRR